MTELTESKGLSQKDFAAVVDLAPSRINQLIGEGLPVLANGKIDEQAGRQWISENLDPARREARKPGSTNGKTTGKAALLRQQILQRELEDRDLDLAKKRGELIDRKAAERTIFERARLERDRWIAWIARTAPDLANATGADPAETFAALDKAVRLHLIELSETPVDAL